MAKIQDINRIPSLIKELNKANKRKTEVGFFDDWPFLLKVAARNEFGAQITVTQAYANMLYAMAKENGYPTEGLPKVGEKMTIPERSFMRSAFDANFSAMSIEMSKLMLSFIEGDLPESYNAQYNSGQVLQEAIARNVASGDFAPNDPFTIAIKGHDRPLIGKTGVLETTQGIRVRVVRT